MTQQSFSADQAGKVDAHLTRTFSDALFEVLLSEGKERYLWVCSRWPVRESVGSPAIPVRAHVQLPATPSLPPPMASRRFSALWLPVCVSQGQPKAPPFQVPGDYPAQVSARRAGLARRACGATRFASPRVFRQMRSFQFERHPFIAMIPIHSITSAGGPRGTRPICGTRKSRWVGSRNLCAGGGVAAGPRPRTRTGPAFIPLGPSPQPHCMTSRIPFDYRFISEDS